MKSYAVTPQMKATEQYFPVLLFIKLYKVVLTFESGDEILWCDHSNESYWTVLSCGSVYYAVEGGSNFWVCGWNPMVWPFKWKLLSSTFLWYYLSSCLNSSSVVWLHPYLVHILTEHSLELSQVKVVSSKHSHRSSGDIFFVQIKVELCLSTKRVYYTQLAPKNKNRLCNSK